MNKSNTQKLYADFPRLYREAGSKKSMMQYGFETNDGWFDLIYKLSADIEAEAKSMGLNPDSKEWPCALQVKEKFGTLKFYCAMGKKKEKLQPEESGPLLCFRPLPDNKAIRALIMQAEKESATICEVCGSPSELRLEGWRRVTCDKCEAERQAMGVGDGSKYENGK
ncbi:MAG: hypothetical protein ACYCTH_13295 [Cellulomonas sp.]